MFHLPYYVGRYFVRTELFASKEISIFEKTAKIVHYDSGFEEKGKYDKLI